MKLFKDGKYDKEILKEKTFDKKIRTYLKNNMPFSLLVFGMVYFLLVIFKFESVENKVNKFLELDYKSKFIIYLIYIGIVIINFLVIGISKNKTELRKIFIVIISAIVQITISLNKTILKIEIYTFLLFIIFMLVQFMFIIAYFINKIIKENTDYNNIMLLITIIGFISGIIIGII